MLLRITPAGHLPQQKHVGRQACLQLAPDLPGQMPAGEKSTCGSRGCKAGSSQIMATCVKKHLTAERLAFCFGKSLIFWASLLYMRLPRTCVNSKGTAVSSKFKSNGVLPSAAAFWWSHLHHDQKKVA